MLLVILLLGLAGITRAAGTGETFTYQGRLDLNGSSVSDTCDFEFSLWDAETGGSQVGTTQTATSVTVSDGLFSVELNFGTSVFTGDARWLEIAVRCPAGSGGYSTLTPRQALNPTPYAVFAGGAPWSGLTGVPAGLDDGDDDTTYSAGTGLDLTGTTFSVTGAPWSGLTGVPTGLNDGDDDTTYAAGTGLDLTGTTFSVTGAPWSGLTGVPAGLDDGDDDTTYAAGTGLDLTGTTFSVTGAPWSGLTGVPTGLDDGDDDTLAGLSCSADQVAQWNGSAWVCTTVSGGESVPSGAAILTDNSSAPSGYTYGGDQVMLAGTGTWLLKASRTGASDDAAAVVDDKIYNLGGNDENYDPWAAIAEYDPATNTWTTKTSMSTARAELAAAAVGGYVYAIGGENDSNDRLATVERYDPVGDSWTNRASLNIARTQLSAAMVDGKIYAIGGYHGASPYTIYNTVEEYDPITNTWTIKSPMPTPRYDLAVIAWNNEIYAIGGYYDGNYSRAVEKYTPSTDTWETLASLPWGSYEARGVALDGKIYLTTDGIVYDIATDTWSYMVPNDTSWGVAAVAGGLIYTISGGLVQQYVPPTYWYLQVKD
jgi:N-acetylneuraminic acid mutarotase